MPLPSTVGVSDSPVGRFSKLECSTTISVPYRTTRCTSSEGPRRDVSNADLLDTDTILSVEILSMKIRPKGVWSTPSYAVCKWSTDVVGNATYNLSANLKAASSLYGIAELFSRVKYESRGSFCYMAFTVVDYFCPKIITKKSAWVCPDKFDMGRGGAGVGLGSGL